MSFEIIRYNENIRLGEKPLEKYGSGGRFRVCLAYPNTYRAGMSSLGFLSIFDLIARTTGFFCDRAFLPDPQIMKYYRNSRRKLMGFQSEIPLQEFDILAFSISYEPDYLNFLKMMELAGIPPLPAQRDESHPLIIAGGSAVSINPETVAPFFDLIFIGEAETSLSAFLKGISNLSRNEILRMAVSIPGIYVPSLYDFKYDGEGFIRDVKISGGAVFPVPWQVEKPVPGGVHSSIVSPHAEFSDSFLVEVSRGCPYSCRFCTMGNTGKPYRYKELDDIKKSVDMGLKLTSHIGLLGAAVGSHPRIGCILDYIRDGGGSVSFSSLRADVLQGEIIEKLVSLGQKTITLAPEVGSDRLRRHIGKTMKTADLMNTAEMALNAGFNEIRLYFMAGLPGETREDIKEAVSLIRQVESIARSRGARIFASINQFVPKPGTPFEIYPFMERREWDERIALLVKPLAGSGIVHLKVEDPDDMLIQAFLGRGNREWAGFMLENYHRSAGGFARRIMKLKSPAVKSLVFSPLPEEDGGRKYPWRVTGHVSVL